MACGPLGGTNGAPTFKEGLVDQTPKASGAWAGSFVKDQEASEDACMVLSWGRRAAHQLSQGSIRHVQHMVAHSPGSRVGEDYRCL